MTDQQEPIKIEIEDETVAQPEKSDIADELRNLGKQFANTLDAAWNSEERQRVEGEIREGLQNFADEVSKLFNEAKESSAGQRVRTEAEKATHKVSEAELGTKAKSSLAQGLGWLSNELGRLANKFTPTEGETTREKSPEDIDDGV